MLGAAVIDSIFGLCSTICIDQAVAIAKDSVPADERPDNTRNGVLDYPKTKTNVVNTDKSSGLGGGNSINFTRSVYAVS